MTLSVALTQAPVDEARSVRAAEIFAVLKGRILRWEYPPGYRFTEEAISREFAVSRSPVRETLRMLEEHDLVEKVPYRGCTVRQPNIQAIGEQYDVRLALELAVVERLAEQGLAPMLHTALAAAWADLAQTALDAEVDGAALAEADRAFHEALAEAAGNRTLCELLRTINDRLHFIRMTDITSVERLHKTCHQHLTLLAAIAAGDATAARTALRANVEGARAHVHAAVKEVLARAYLQETGRQGDRMQALDGRR